MKFIIFLGMITFFSLGINETETSTRCQELTEKAKVLTALGVRDVIFPNCDEHGTDDKEHHPRDYHFLGPEELQEERQQQKKIAQRIHEELQSLPEDEQKFLEVQRRQQLMQEERRQRQEVDRLLEQALNGRNAIENPPNGIFQQSKPSTRSWESIEPRYRFTGRNSRVLLFCGQKRWRKLFRC